ncbi:MAG TPA: hypothetical protein VFB29_06105 [Pseudolabrys sp.]|nr:hypothetical protein [Pseudolabrys sp.]
MSPASRTSDDDRPGAIFAQLAASIGLAVCTLVAATIVSIGMARADVATSVIDNESGLFAIALLLGLLFIGLSGLTALSLPHPRHKKSHG